MISKLLISFVLLVFLITVGGFAVLAVWDVPVTQKTVEKPIESTRFANNKP